MSEPKGNLFTPVHARTDGQLRTPAISDSDSLMIAHENTYLDNPSNVMGSYANLSLAAGTNNLDMLTFPADAKFMLKAVSFRYTGTITSVIVYLESVRDAVAYPFYYLTGLTSARLYAQTFDILFEPDDILRAEIRSATLNNDFEAWWILQRVL